MSGLHPLSLWVRGQWRDRWAALVSLAVLVALVGGVTLGVAAAARRADTSIDRFLAHTRHTNVDLGLVGLEEPTPELLASLPSPTTMVEALEGVEGVRGVTALSFIGAAPGVDDEPPGPDVAYFSGAYGAASGDSLRFRFVDGRAPEPEDPHQVVVNEAAPSAWRIAVGDTMTLHTLAPDQVDSFVRFPQEPPRGPRIDVEVVGVFRGIEDITDFPEPFVVMTPAFLDRYGDEVINVTGGAFVNADPARLDQVVADVQAVAPEGYQAGPATEDFAGRVRDVLSVEVTALQIFALAAGLVGLAVVFQAVVRHLGTAVEATQVGRALGMRRRQLLTGSVAAVLPALMAGLGGATLVALAVSAVVPRGVARRADPDPSIGVDWAVALAGALLMAVVLVVVALIAAVLVLRRARAPLASRRLAGSSAARHPAVGLPLTPALGIRYALGGGRGLRTVGWSGMTGAAIGVAGIVAVSIVAGSAATLLDSPRLWGATWDAVITVEEAEDLAGASETLAGDPDVEAVAMGRVLANSDVVSAEGPSGESAVDPLAFQPVTGDMGPVVTHGRAPVGPDEVAVGSTLADRLGAAPGDEVVLRTPRGAFPVTMVGTLLYPDHNELGDRLVLTPEGLDSLRAGCAPDSDELSCVVMDHTLGVRYRPGVDAGAATARLAAEVQGLRLPQRPSVVNNLDQIGITPWLLAGFLALLGLAGLAHALVIGSRRQRRDLAVFRALGLGRRQTAAVVWWQGVVLTGLGAIAGLAFGLLAGRLVWQGVAGGIGALVDIDLSPWIVLVLPPAAVLAGLVAASVPARWVARQCPADVLRTE